MSERDKLDDIYDLLKTGAELLDEHEDKLKNVMGGSGEVNLTEQAPLKHIEKTDDEVIITVEGDGGFSSISVMQHDGKVVIEMNEKEVIAEVPDDVNIGETNAQMNNGVLDVTIPRGED